MDRIPYSEIDAIREAQAEKVRTLQAETDTTPAQKPTPAGEVPGCDRETAVTFMVEVQGLTREQAEKDYDLAARKQHGG